MKQVAVRFPMPMIVEIDAERAAKLDRPERAVEIRALVAEALAARRAKRAAEGKRRR